MKAYQNRKSKRVIRVLGIVVVVFFVLILVANYIVSREAEKQIRIALTEHPVSGYHITLGHVHVNLLTFSVTLKNLQVVPSPAQSKKHSVANRPALKMQIPLLRFKHVSALSMLLGNKELIIQKIVAKKVKVVLYAKADFFKRRKTQHLWKKQESLLQLPVQGISALNIHSILIEKSEIYWVDPVRNDTILKTKGVNFLMKKIHFREKHPGVLIPNLKQTKWFFIDKVLKLKTGKYTFSMQQFLLDVPKHVITFKNISLIPNRNIYTLASEAKYRTSVYRFVMKRADVYLDDLEKMFTSGIFHIPGIKITKSSLLILRNGSLPLDKSKYKLLPDQWLKKLKTHFYIDSLMVDQCVFVYEESNNEKQDPIKITFSNLWSKIGPVTSIRDSMGRKGPMRVTIGAVLQKQIPVRLQFEFPMMQRDTFRYYGSLGSGQLAIFNNVLTNKAGVQFKKGNLNNISFEVQSNAKYAIGKMTMRYHHLIGTVLKKNHEEGNRFLTWIVNRVVKSDNPMPGEAIRTAPIFYERYYYQGFGAFIFRPVLSGILASTVNSVARSNQKNIDTQLHKTKRDIRKRKREKRARMRER